MSYEEAQWVAYRVGDAVIYRTLATLSMSISGGRVDLRVGLGEVARIEGTLGSPLEPTAELCLFGQMTVSCSLRGAGGESLADASWESPFCQAAIEDLEMESLLASR